MNEAVAFIRECMEAQPFPELDVPLVVIRGNIPENIRKAKEYCRFAIDQHMNPIATHLLYPQILSKQETQETRELALYMGRQIIRKCRELWWFGDEPTDGMKEEIDYANRQASAGEM